MLPSPAWPKQATGMPVSSSNCLAKLDQLDEFGARDDDVLVELGQAGVAQGVGKLAAEFPDPLAGRLVRRALDEGGAEFG